MEALRRKVFEATVQTDERRKRIDSRCEVLLGRHLVDKCRSAHECMHCGAGLTVEEQLCALLDEFLSQFIRNNATMHE